VKIISSLTCAAAVSALLGFGDAAAHAACLDLKPDARQTFEGRLHFRVFGGSPYNGGVNKGDTPEPTYIVKLDNPVCVDGNDLSDPIAKADEVQIFPDHDHLDRLFNSMRRLVGRRVRVEGKSAFTAHTGHHHAPLLLPISVIVETSDPGDAEGGGRWHGCGAGVLSRACRGQW
jgi:Domain of unknown function (DUF4431)